jgi:peptidoglycan/xylan/chitin deacetylase (PgdA/CDA1 family)
MMVQGKLASFKYEFAIMANCISLSILVFYQLYSPSTSAVLDYLKSIEKKATFFVVGSRIAQSEEAKSTLRRAYQDGHQIAMHSWSHSALSKLKNEEIVAEVMWTGKIIKDVTGVFPKYFRP